MTPFLKMEGAMTTAFLDHITNTLAQIDAEGMSKRERLITSPQSGKITVNGKPVINLWANNYLGLADHPDLIKAASDVMDTKGFGMASVRFICGTQDLHRELEQRLARFLDKDDAICLPHVLMQTEAYSNRFWGRRMRSFRML